MEAEALALALEALRLHMETGFSPRSGLYTAFRRFGARVEALRLARRVLHVYSVKRGEAGRILREVAGEAELGWRARTLLELLFSAVLGGLRLGDLDSLVVELRKTFGGSWPMEVEPYLGVIRWLRPGAVAPAENYPRWFSRYLKRVLGRMTALELMSFQDKEKPPTYVVVNMLKDRVEEILEEAERRGVRLREDSRLKGVFVVKVENTWGLVSLAREGLISIHDFSSYYAVEALDPKPGETLLDICAAPGTKTWLSAMKMRNRGRIISVDSSKQRIRAHKKRMKLMGVKVAEQLEADATRPLPLRLQADRVLVDPPCSSTGLFWREPAYRWTVKPRHVKMFMRLQAKILREAARHVKPGGTLLYSTCSLTLEENELVIEDFLKTNPDFSAIEVEEKEGSPGYRGLEEARRLYPHRDYCNGFFLIKLRRK